MSGIYTRVTNSMTTNSFIRDMQKNMSAIEKLQKQITTGKRIETPSDDPIAADRILDYTQTIAQIDQYQQNIADAKTTFNSIDSVLDTIETALMRARDLAVKASNEAPENDQSRKAIAAEIDSIINELVTQANQQYDGKYLFSGNEVNTQPFEAKKSISYVYTGASVAAGGATTLDMPSSTIEGSSRQCEAITDANSVKAIYINGKNLVTDLGGSYTVDPSTNTISITSIGANGTDPVTLQASDTIEIQFDKVVSVEYSGNSGTREFEISAGVTVPTSFAGAVSAMSGKSSVFGQFSGDASETASVEAFQKLIDLRDSILKYDGDSTDLDKITRGISDIDDITERVTQTRSEEGSYTNRLTLAATRLTSTKTYTSKLQSSYESTDLTEAITELVLQQNVYQASLGVSARIIQTTLLDFLS